MSFPDSSNRPGGPYRKPRADIYTMLLILSLIALLLGILCLYAEMAPYEFKFRGFQGNLTAPAQLPTALTALDRRHVANGTAWKAADGLPSVVA